MLHSPPAPNSRQDLSAKAASDEIHSPPYLSFQSLHSLPTFHFVMIMPSLMVAVLCLSNLKNHRILDIYITSFYHAALDTEYVEGVLVQRMMGGCGRFSCVHVPSASHPEF